MSDLQDFIADANGITLHRRRVLTAFSHVSAGPLMDVLFNVTRPSLRITKPDPAKPTSHAPHAPAVIVRKGMVNYRRELYGLSDEADTHF